jgi:serine/threonine protein kinase
MGFNPEDYSYRQSEWKLWVHHDMWTSELAEAVFEVIREQPPSKHPQTVRLQSYCANSDAALYLKIFHGSSGMSALKDMVRSSKALRSMRQAAALTRFRFNVPVTVAAGEQREHRLLRKAFVLTIEVKGESLPAFLKPQGLGVNRIGLSEKRQGLRQLAAEVRRLHELGFVHGDLVPTNIFVSRTSETECRFFFMDNDRTRHYPKWMPHLLWRRNLVQLNRIPLPGITLQDRVRFLMYYLGLKQWGDKERRLLLWLEQKTRQRRKACDAVDANGSFRQLMRWRGELT